MMRLIPSALSLIMTIAPGPPAPATNIEDLKNALFRCFAPPPGSAGSEMTVRFSLRRNGTILGKPTITYARLSGDDQARRAFAAAVLGSLSACTPVSLSAGLGSAIAGKMIALRFISSRQDISL